METNTQVQEQVQAPAKRGRKEKLTFERCQTIVALGQSSGRTLKALAAERHIPYISLIVALKRHGLSPRAKVAVATAEVTAA
jgi:hypothetical protein